MRRIFCLLICLPLVSIARDSLNVVQVGQHVSCWYETSAIEVQGNYAYVATGASGLHIVDISDLETPHEVGYSFTRGETRDVALQGNYAYLAEGADGLRVVNISTPSSPDVVAVTNPASGNSLRIALSATHAFIVNDYNGLQIFDITSPTAPTIVYTYALTAPQDIQIVGSLAYVVTSDALTILDISNPASPQFVGSVPDLDQAVRVFVTGTRAFIVCHSDPLKMVDISNPASPEVFGNLYEGHAAVDVAASGDVLYILRSNVEAYDISNPDMPEFLDSYPSVTSINAIALVGNTLLAADWAVGLVTIDVAVPSSFDVLGSLLAPAEYWSVVASGDYAYASGPIEKVQVFDVSNPSAPELVSTSRYNGTVNDMVVSGTYLYLTYINGYGVGGAGFRVLDISNPRSLTEIGNLPINDNITGVAVSGDYAILSSSGSTHLVDISNPAEPALVFTVNNLHGAMNVVVDGNYAYVADFEDLRILDITNPALPLQIGSYDSPAWVYDVAVSGNVAYLAESWGVRTVDISDPHNPVSVGQFSTPYPAKEVSLIGNVMYVAVGEYGLRIVDANVPTNLHEVGYYVEDFKTITISAQGDYVYSGDEYAFSIYDVSTAIEIINGVNADDPIEVITEFALNPIYPNPFNNTANISFDLPREVTGKLVVYDMLGRMTNTLYDGKLAAGSHSMQFNGNNLSTGIYFIRLETPAFTATQKAVLLK